MDAALPRLLLVAPPLDQPAADALAGDFERVLDSLPPAQAAAVGALLLRGGSLDDDGLAARCAAVLALAQGRDVAVLLEDRPALLERSGADGLHLTLTPKGSPLKELRRRFGEDVILGAGCGASRHLAMTAGEQGADYIGFGAIDGDAAGGGAADPEMIAWWEAVMTPPQVAFGAPDLAQAREQAAAGADFLGLAPALWLSREQSAGQQPETALTALLATLEQGA